MSFLGNNNVSALIMKCCTHATTAVAVEAVARGAHPPTYVIVGRSGPELGLSTALRASEGDAFAAAVGASASICNTDRPRQGTSHKAQ